MARAVPWPQCPSSMTAVGPAIRGRAVGRDEAALGAAVSLSASEASRVAILAGGGTSRRAWDDREPPTSLGRGPGAGATALARGVSPRGPPRTAATAAPGYRPPARGSAALLLRAALAAAAAAVAALVAHHLPVTWLHRS